MSAELPDKVYKNVAIPLYGLKRKHGPIDKESGEDEFGENGSFVGRLKLIKSLSNLLRKTSGRRGTYLIAGYRGSGKTSLVNYVINKYREEKNNKSIKSSVIKVPLNLGNDHNLTPIRLFYSIANSLLDEFRKEQGREGGVSSKVKKTTFYVGMLLIPIMVFDMWVSYRGGVSFLDRCVSWFHSQALFDSVFFLGFILLVIGIGNIYLFVLKNRKAIDIENRLECLIERISHEVTDSTRLGSKSTLFGFVKGRRSLPVHAREAEELLVGIIDDLSNKSGVKHCEVIFVFDEIDKLSRFDDVGLQGGDSEGKEKLKNINQLLGSIKYFITTCNAKFFILSGRETLDSYYSEKGSANSLYESLFDGVYEVPSLLTDDGGVEKTQISRLIEEYLCKAISWEKGKSQKEGEEDRYTLRKYFEYLRSRSGIVVSESRCRDLVSQLRSFVSYLVFHSWGNPKRLSVLLESFVIPGEYVKKYSQKYDTFGFCVDENVDWLSISINDKRSIALASEIFTLFQHHLSREVSKTSDKLTVSALSSLHFILKLHPYGFTRESLHRMSEAINIYRSPELNTIVDDLLTQILKSYIRRVRNGSYRYRFNSGLEQELRYVSHVNELESASYNFSLNAMGPVKRVFERKILDNSDLDDVSKAKLYMTLGDMCTIEQSYNSASINYGIARSLMEKVISRDGAECCFDNVMLFCELGVKQGDLEERRQNYNHAAAIYGDLEVFVNNQMRLNRMLNKVVRSGDSKWDVIKQAAWANMFLSLKRSPASSIVRDLSNMYPKGDARMYSRMATFYYFMGRMGDAKDLYNKVICDVHIRDVQDEKEAYIKGNALVGMSEVSLLTEAMSLMSRVHEDLIITREKIMESLGRFVRHAEIGGASSNYVVSDPHGIAKVSCGCGENFSVYIEQAAKCFKKNGLYVSAVISYIKIISYWVVVLDFFVREDVDVDLKEKIRKVFEKISLWGREAVECIVLARQLDSSQFSKTFIVRDLPENYCGDDLVGLFDVLLSYGGGDDGSLSEPIVWQQSLWAHKLASTLCWAGLVRNKLLDWGDSKRKKYPYEMSSLSVRSAITMRWVVSRDMMKEFMLEKYIISWRSDLGWEKSGVFSPLKYLRLMREKASISLGYLGESLSNDYVYKDWGNESIHRAYQISRNLYFALQSIRLISRKNIDLVFPNMAQIYFVQWKLLAILMTLHMIRDYQNSGGTGFSSIRHYALEIQRKFLKIDEHLAPDERIPPTHFDYEHIFMRAKSNLFDAMNFNDPSSRVRSSVLQQKHYCHDDHSDPEFRLDWTLAHMFSPSAGYLVEHIDETHKMFKNLIESK